MHAIVTDPIVTRQIDAPPQTVTVYAVVDAEAIVPANGSVTVHIVVDAHGAAEILGIGFGTVRNWTSDGVLPCIKYPGGAVLYRVDELEAFKERHHRPAVRARRRKKSAKADAA